MARRDCTPEENERAKFQATVLNDLRNQGAKEGELLLGQLERMEEQRFILMDRAYEGDSMRAKARDKGFIPIVPPKRNRKEPWAYDRGDCRKNCVNLRYQIE